MKGLFAFFFTSALAILAAFPGAAVGAGLKVGFYNKTCPSAETLVQQAVAAAFKNNSGIAAGLIRMHFHDCFVRGCDGSVLIDSTANNTAEKDTIPNRPSLRGFEVIDAAKKALEARCPRTVSCADILAFAARGSVALNGNLLQGPRGPARRQDLQGHRRSQQPPLAALERVRARRQLHRQEPHRRGGEDMVVLSGAHTVGRSHCSSFTNRLYGFSNASDVDPTISAAYALLLRGVCPANSSQFFPTTTTAMDLMTPAALDNRYYVGLANNLGLFTSDQALLTNATLRASVDAFVKSEKKWKSKFARAMVKMGGIEVLTGTQGEIRLNCRVINRTTAASDDGSAEEFDEIAME
ncbi:hypothetical protein ACP70R_033714 [Stipagrostis hirtigluma subsp. patula]